MENIISIDETSIDTHLCYNYGWSKSGSKTIIKKTNKKIRYTVISAIGFNKVILNKIIKGSCNGEIFLHFIKELLIYFPKNENRKIILDNARIHHYRKLKEYIKKTNNVDFIYNIPYSPESNPIEKVFNEIKQKLKKVKFNNENILREIKKSFNTISGNNITKYYKKSLNFY